MSRSGLAVGLAAVALLAGGAAYTTLQPEPKPEAEPIPSPFVLPTYPPAPDPPPDLPPAPDPVATVAGRPLAERTGLTLLLWGEGLVRYDLDARKRAGVELADGFAGSMLLPVRGGTLALISANPGPDSATDVWRFRPGRNPERIGRAADIVAGADRDSVWFVTRNSQETYASRHDLGGRQLGPLLTLPPRVRVRAETPHGLFVESSLESSYGIGYQLADVRTGKLRPVELNHVAAVAGRWVVSPLGDSTDVERRDLGSGRLRRATLPGYVDNWLVSPDGTRMAGFAAGNGLPAPRLVVLDLATMRVRDYPDVVLPPDVDSVQAWSADSRWLVFHVPAAQGPEC